MCSRCKEAKEVAEFHKDRTTKDGYQWVCRSCSSIRDRARYRNNPNKEKARAAAYKAANQEKVAARNAAYRRANKHKVKQNSERSFKRRQGITSTTAVNHRKEWTGPELELISDQSRTTKSLAIQLGRTYAAVAYQRRLLKIDPRKDRLAGIPHKTKTPPVAASGVSSSNRKKDM